MLTCTIYYKNEETTVIRRTTWMDLGAAIHLHILDDEDWDWEDVSAINIEHEDMT